MFDFAIKLETMLRRIYLYTGIIAMVFFTCTRENLDNKVIETATSLSYIEIINYQPTASENLTSGYKKESFTLIGDETFSPVDEDHLSAEKSNKNLFIDSAQFSFLREIETSDLVKNNKAKSLISKEEISIPDEFPELKGKKIKLVSVSSRIDENLFFTLEVPEDITLNWSLIKIWKLSENDGLPQIHSLLFARANNFESLSYKDSGILLKEGNMIYRVELDKEKRFHKKMNVFVSLSMETP